MKRTIFTIIAFVFCSSAILAQEEAKLIKGDNYFDNYTFSKAIEQYESLTERNTATNEKLAKSMDDIARALQNMTNRP